MCNLEGTFVHRLLIVRTNMFIPGLEDFINKIILSYFYSKREFTSDL